MGWLSWGAGIVATLLLYDREHPVLLCFTIAATVGAFWTNGIMHNYAMEAAKRRPGFTGGFSDITAEEAQSVPDKLAFLNMLFSIACFGFLAAAFLVARS